jgi:hypothetical protein
MPPMEDLESRVCIETVPGVKQILYERVPLRPIKGGVAPFIQFSCEDHVWFEYRWMVASLCDE